MRKAFIGRRKALLNLIGVTAAWILVLIIGTGIQADSTEGVIDLKARSEDQSILLSWKALPKTRNCFLELTIEDGEQSEVIRLDADETSFEFCGGQHGELYTFQVELKDYQENVIEKGAASALYLNYAQLPGLPIVQIETKNGILPSYSVRNPPKNLEEIRPAFGIGEIPTEAVGKTIADNEYVDARVILKNENRSMTNVTGKIRLRGNTSVYTQMGKPYKLKLDHKLDFLNRESSVYMDDEWLLLPMGFSFKLVVGTRIAELLGMEWQPQYLLVNLMINGDWQGCYYLIESVKRSEGRLKIDNDGFIVENDAYWWNEGVYFRKLYQYQDKGITFKYPKGKNVTKSIVQEIRDCLISFDRSVVDGDGDYTSYMDVDSFAAWLLTHDIMGTFDGGGSNAFLYKSDMSDNSKLKVGPVWDFDSAFLTENEWSRVRTEGSLHFMTLLEKEAFREAYNSKWNDASHILCRVVWDMLDEYSAQHDDDLQLSWNLQAERWGVQPVSVDERINETRDWFDSRKVWLDQQIGSM